MKKAAGDEDAEGESEETTEKKPAQKAQKEWVLKLFLGILQRLLIIELI